MQFITRKKLNSGMGLTCVTTSKFKRSVVRLALILPLGGAGSAERAALPHVLRRGTARLPDLRIFGAELDELYGARIEAISRKEGENLVIGFIADCIDGQYAPDAGGLTKNVINLLAELLFTPLLRGGAFDEHYVSGERGNLLDRIAAQKNDPRSYAMKRLAELMCENEKYGKSVYGTEGQAENITAGSMFEAYQRVLGEAVIELFYCGAMRPDDVESLFMETLFARRIPDRLYMPSTEVIEKPKSDRRVIIEEEAVTQGKLSLGFRTGGNSLCSGDPVAYWMFQTVYGGSTSAKLFMNVREKRSLCYYASAQFIAHKGLLLVGSGIENKNFEAAKDEILEQLSICREGGISDEELESARDTLRNSWLAVLDDPLSLERYWLAQAVAGTLATPEERISRLEKVTKEQAVECARATELDTVYFMKGAGK